MPIVRIGVLGPLDIRLENEEPLAFESVKGRALLAYLAVEAGRLHSRERLAGILWPNRPDSAALANLRHTLSAVRTTLGERLRGQAGSRLPILNVSASTIQLNPEADVWVDLSEFEACLAAIEREGANDLPARIHQLSMAVALYRGRFIEGFSLRGCPEFEDWMLLRREHISLQVQKALRNLANAHEAAGDWEPALSALRRLLQLEPWDESAHRQVMALLAAQNQRNAAIGQFEHCRRILSEELGVEPEADTIRLYEQIRAGKFTLEGIKPWAGKPAGTHTGLAEDPALSFPAKSLLSRPAQARFVGRQHQLAKLRQALDLALEGHGQVVLISGEAGSGKTSLAWEFAYQAMGLHSDLLIVAGSCNSITGFEDPYLPFREMVQMLAGLREPLEGYAQAPEHLRRLTSAFPDIIKSVLSYGPELIGPFLPKESLIQRIETYGPGKRAWLGELHRASDQTAAKLALAPGAITYRPIEPVTRMLVELARHRPLILFLDDLQWADAGSVSLLRYLCKHLAGSRVVVVGAYRPQDVASGRRLADGTWERHPLEPVRLELQREFGELEVDLDQPEGISFTNAILDTEPNRLPEAFRQTLYRLTNGNPLFTLELLRSMQARADIVKDSSGMWVEGTELNWDRLPARVEAVIAERIGRLPPHQQSLLRAASVEGETFTAEVVARVLVLAENQVINLLSGPLSREQQIVKALKVEQVNQAPVDPPGRLSRYRFNHILFQKYLYNQLDLVERSALHGACGAALEALYGDEAEAIALQLAWQFEQAGRIARAAEYLLSAGKQAVYLSAYPQAKELYNRCLGLIQQLPESPERTRLEIQVQLARGAPLFAIEGWGTPEANRAVNRAVELMEQSGWSSTHPDILLALFLQADLFSAQSNMPEARARADLLLQRTLTGADRPYQVLAYLAAGQAYLLSGQLVAATGYLEQAISIYHPEDLLFFIEATGYNALHAAITWNAWTQWLLGNTGRALALRQQVIELARQQESQFPIDTVIVVAGAFLAALMDEPEQAGTFAQECLNRSHHGRTPVGKILSETILGWVQVKQGELDCGLSQVQQGIDDWKITGAQIMQPVNLIFLADALSLSGQPQAGLEVVMQVKTLIEKTGRRVLEPYAHWLEGEILARQAHILGHAWKPDHSPVECFQRAIEIARRQQSRALELRAIISLARWLQEDGQAQEAYRQLDVIVGFFDAEVENRDLQTARSLLSELADEIQIYPQEGG